MGQQTPPLNSNKKDACMWIHTSESNGSLSLSHLSLSLSLSHTHTHTHLLKNAWVLQSLGTQCWHSVISTQSIRLHDEHHSSPRETFLHISCLSPRNKRPLCPRAVKDWGLRHCQDRGQMQPQRMENLISASMGGLTRQIFLHRASVQQISA